MEELARAKKKALALLTDMDRTERELYEKLKKKDFSEEVIAETMAYVKSFGYLDDARYAFHYIETQKKSRSRKRIIFDLTKKGIDRDTLAQALEEQGMWDEKPLILHYLMKKDKSLKTDDEKRWQKLAAHLNSKGFAASDITQVLQEYFHKDESEKA